MDKALALTKANTAEGNAVRSIVEFLEDIDDEDGKGEDYARAALKQARTKREKGLAYIAIGYVENTKGNWGKAVAEGDEQSKAFANALLADRR